MKILIMEFIIKVFGGYDMGINISCELVVIFGGGFFLNY